MTNLLTALPDFDVSPFSHLLPSLERALISTADLLTLDPLLVAKRAQVPPVEVRKLADALLDGLHASARPQPASAEHAFEGDHELVARWATISTLDDHLDAALGGGIALGNLTEIVGESAVGKTQFLLTLLLSSQLLKDAKGHQRSALYISTEAPLQTTRLAQILKVNDKLSGLPANERPSLARVHSTHIHDVEAQEHILRFQAPVAIEKHNVGILVIDSIAANYRAEFDKGGRAHKGGEAIAKRNTQLAQLGSLLRGLARKHNMAVVVANQVADRFTLIEPTPYAPTQSTQTSRPGSPPQIVGTPMPIADLTPKPSVISTDDPLALDHQQRFFTGWGDDATVTNLKTPSLGLTWTNQLACRIALVKAPIYEVRAYAPGDERNQMGWRRHCKVVFSAWAAEGKVEFEIWQGGIRGVREPKRNEVSQ